MNRFTPPVFITRIFHTEPPRRRAGVKSRGVWLHAGCPLVLFEGRASEV